MNRVLSKGLTTMAFNSSQKTINIYNQLASYYKSIGAKDYSLLRSSPLINGVLNHLLDLKDKSDEISQLDFSKTNLIDFIPSFVFLNVDTLVSFRRNPKTLPIVIDRLFKESVTKLQQLDIDADIVSGS
jgi:hypothetical protein